LASDVQAAVARVVDRALPPNVPVRPAKVQIVLVAAVLALFLGAMASLLMDRLDNTVKGGDDAELRLRQPVLTALPLLSTTDRPKMARVFLEDAHSHYAEGIRTARTGVLLSNLDAPSKVLLVTSTLPNEGKTTVAVNLALAHSQTKRTLLIDCDMRRAQAARSLGIPAGAKGLTNLVAGNADVAGCLYEVKDSKLMVMPVGDMPPNPLELLLSQKFKETLKLLSEQFEMIVIDSPPVELVSEALVLAPLVTSVAFVVKAMSTPAPLARKSIARIQRAGGNILGLVVNQLDFKHAQRYYGEYGAGSYDYGGYRYGSYGYGSTPQLTEGGSGKKRKAAPDTIT
jgi:capsular exopolysaccharide synthesis family protein